MNTIESTPWGIMSTHKPAPIEWIVNGLLPASGSSLFVATPKTGKSAYTRQLSHCVTTGEPFLGRSVKQGAALYISTQESHDNIQRHFQAMRTPQSAPLHVSSRPRGFDRNKALDAVEAKLEANPSIRLVVIDMLQEFFPFDNSNDYSEATDRLAELGGLTARRKVHICCTSHAKKASVENEVHSVMGSTAIPGSFDQIISISVDSKKNRYISTRQRYGEDLPRTSLQWDRETHMAEIGFTTDELKMRQKDDTKTRLKSAILGYVEDHGGCTQDEIIGAVEGSTQSKTDTLKKLSDGGFLARSGTGAKNSKFTYAICLPKEPLAA